MAEAPSRRLAEEWALVLAAEGLASRVAAGEGGWMLFVAAADAGRAEAALASYLRENRPPDPAPAHFEWRGAAPLRASLLLVASLLVFHLATGPVGPGSTWFEAGAATARIVVDEPWRAVTALTLHADAGHALANALAGGVFLTLWLRVWGPGVGLLAVLASGVLGNGLNAALRAPDHVSLGASTAVFGAVGLLAGVAAWRRRSGARARRRPWLALAASLALLAMLGTGGERTDLWAHAFGLLSGAGLGAAGAAGLRAPPGPRVQLAAGALFAAAIPWAWHLALA